MLAQAERLADGDPDEIDYSTLRIRATGLDSRFEDFVQIELKVEVK